MLEFNDGVSFDTTGKLRVEWRHDGAYVVGDGMMMPVADREAGLAAIERIKARRKAAEKDTR